MQHIQTDSAQNCTLATQLTAQGISLSTTQAPTLAKGTRTALPPCHLMHRLGQDDSSGGDNGEDSPAKQVSDKIILAKPRAMAHTSCCLRFANTMLLVPTAPPKSHSGGVTHNRGHRQPKKQQPRSLQKRRSIQRKCQQAPSVQRFRG